MLAAAHPTCARWHAATPAALRPFLGRLLTPRDHRGAADTLALGMPVAADNRAFAGFDPALYRTMLDGLDGLPVLFVVVPDVVADAAATDELWRQWAPEILERGLPPAYVAQDGMQAIPPDAAALFLGGSTEYKVGPQGERAVVEAHERDLHVHIGRVNTAGRISYSKTLGAHSFDGTKWAKWSRTYLLDGLRLASAPPAGRLFA